MCPWSDYYELFLVNISKLYAYSKFKIYQIFIYFDDHIILLKAALIIEKVLW